MYFQFNYNNTQINYTDAGSGNIVILLHGFGEDATIWQHQIYHLQSHYRVIVPNLPGTANSQLLQKENCTIEDYAHCIHQLINKVAHNQKVVLLGHSMGGYIALEVAKNYSLQLAGFGLIHSTAYADTAEKKQTRLRSIEVMKEYGVESFLKNTIPNLYSSWFKSQHGQQVEAQMAQNKNAALATLQQYYYAMISRRNNAAVLQETKLPVLFVLGTDDAAAPMQDVLQQCHLPKTSHMHIMPNTAHMGMVEQPQTVNKFIETYLQHVWD